MAESWRGLGEGEEVISPVYQIRPIRGRKGPEDVAGVRGTKSGTLSCPRKASRKKGIPQREKKEDGGKGPDTLKGRKKRYGGFQLNERKLRQDTNPGRGKQHAFRGKSLVKGL